VIDVLDTVAESLNPETPTENLRHLSHWQRVDVLLLHRLRGVVKRCLNVVLRQVRVVLEDLLVRPAVGEQLHEEFDCDPSSFDDRLAGEHLRVEAYSISSMCLLGSWDGRVWTSHRSLSERRHSRSPRVRACTTWPIWAGSGVSGRESGIGSLWTGVGNRESAQNHGGVRKTECGRRTESRTGNCLEMRAECGRLRRDGRRVAGPEPAGMRGPYVHARIHPMRRSPPRRGSGAVPCPVVPGTTPWTGASPWPPPRTATYSLDCLPSKTA